MATYLLLHGAWHGAWCWERVKPLLEAEGHTVHTLTFAGVGERAPEVAHSPRPRIGIDAHIADITEYVQRHDLQDLTVVAHSYAGIPLTGAVTQIVTRVRQLVYLDAFYPIPAYPRVATMLTVRHPPAWLRPWAAQMIALVAFSRPLPPPPLRFLGITDPADQQWVRAHLTPMPTRVWDGTRTLDPPPDSLSTYIWCSGSGTTMGEGFAPYAEEARRHGWPSFTLPTGHDCMITAPEHVAQVLAQIASRVTSPVSV